MSEAKLIWADGSPYGIEDYRTAMVEARRKCEKVEDMLSAASHDAHDWLEEVARACGFQTGRESWWESSEKEQRAKIIARIKRLRANNQPREPRAE